MDQSPTSAVICFRTGPIAEIGGHILLIGACQVRSVSFSKEATQEFFVVFPNDNENIVTCINNIAEDEDIPFFSDFEKEARRLSKLAKSTLYSWVRRGSPELMDEIKEAVLEGEEITQDSLPEMHYLGLLGKNFPSVRTQTKVPLLASWIRPILNLVEPTRTESRL